MTAILDVALHQDQGPVCLADISERQKISLSYLEQLFSKLRRNGLVSSIRGPGGGYRLAALAHDISVGAVIAAVNESVEATKCGGEKSCVPGGRCLTHTLWMDFSQKMRDFLESVSLGELMDSSDVKAISEQQNSAQDHQSRILPISQLG